MKHVHPIVLWVEPLGDVNISIVNCAIWNQMITYICLLSSHDVIFTYFIFLHFNQQPWVKKFVIDPSVWDLFAGIMLSHGCLNSSKIWLSNDSYFLKYKLHFTCYTCRCHTNEVKCRTGICQCSCSNVHHSNEAIRVHFDFVFCDWCLKRRRMCDDAQLSVTSLSVHLI